MKTPGRERGVVLVVSLLILLMLTVIGVSAVNTGILEVRMSSNEERRSETLHVATGAADWVAAGRIALRGNPGDVTDCTANVPNAVGCQRNDIVLTGDYLTGTGQEQVIVRRLHPDIGPPPRMRRREYDVDFRATFFEVESRLRDRGDQAGSARVVRGVMILQPVAPGG